MDRQTLVRRLAAPILGTLLASGAMRTAAPAFAQEASGDALEEIIVTARFREENLQQTSIAISAFTGQELDFRGFQEAYQVAYAVPNASMRPAQAAFGNTMTAFIRVSG